MQIDTMTMTASISEEHKSSILQNIKKSKPPIGKLSFVCKVVPAGCIFLHHLIDLSMSVQHLHYRLSIILEAQRDLAWWQDFLPSWSGTSLILDTHWTPHSSMQLFTDLKQRDGVPSGTAAGCRDAGHIHNLLCLSYGKNSMP